MRIEIERAKRQGLNWQSLLIEDSESEIKDIVRQGFLDGAISKQIEIRVTRVIKSCVEELEDEELKKTTENGLKRLANICWARATKMGQKYPRKVIRAMSTLLGTAPKKAIASAEAVVRAEIVKKQPILAYKEIAQPLKKYMQDYMKEVRNTFFEIAETSAKDGDLSLRSIAEMRTRQQQHEKELQALKDNGTKLAWISSHANCSARCEKWQGKLYSLDGTSGEIDGIKYIPLETATDQYVTTARGKVYRNGILSGFNCRHRLIEYKGAKSRPIEVDAKTVAKEREINDTQRKLERKVRLYRERAVAIKGINGQEYARQRELAIKANAEYIDYSQKHKVAYYPSRVAVFEPKEYVQKRQAEYLKDISE